MEETDSNVDEGRHQRAPLLRNCDSEYVTLGIEKSGQVLWFICSYTAYENSEKKRKDVDEGKEMRE